MINENNISKRIYAMIYVSKSNRFDYKTLETYNGKKGKIVAEQFIRR